MLSLAPSCPRENLFFVWVTLKEQKWISFAEHRGAHALKALAAPVGPLESALSSFGLKARDWLRMIRELTKLRQALRCQRLAVLRAFELPEHHYRKDTQDNEKCGHGKSRSHPLQDRGPARSGTSLLR
jgi:hypothetical protein